MLHSGVAIQRAFEVAAGKTGESRCRQALLDVAAAVRRGEEVSTALREQPEVFPELVVDMVSIGERTGTLPEILGSLADHYENLVRLRRTFLGQIAWPVFQLLAAILVIAFVIAVLGWIGPAEGTGGFQIVPFGLVGTSGAVLWLTMTFGTMFGLFVGFQMIRRTVEGMKWLDGLLLKVPVVGKCLRSFAIARFSWAFALTQQSGMSILPSLQASLRATANGAFLAAAPELCSRVEEGDPLNRALAESRLFPEDYLHMVEVAESSGTVPEMLDHLSPRFEEDARRNLSALASTLAWVVWTLVAIFIVVIVFNIVLQYIALINEMSQPL